MVILSALAMALVLWVGVAGQGILASLDISLGTLTAFVLLLQRFSCRYEPGQRVADRPGRPGGVGAHLPGAGAPVRGACTQAPAPASVPEPRRHRHAGGVLWLPARPPRAAWRVVGGAAGEHIVLVGRTGAGKSSVLHLLGGLYTPWSGTLQVAGADPTSLTDDQRRRSMGVVLQVVQLFRGTVFENLTLGDVSVSRDAVQRAAAIAGADSFIQALPRGMTRC